MRWWSRFILLASGAVAWTPTSTVRSNGIRQHATTCLQALPGADIEQPPVGSRADAASDLSTVARGKLNEIDFCIAPADVSLSRAYNRASSESSTTSSQPTLSLTRALNNASNRAVRRILLARSWPSAEALNLSLRRAAIAEQERELAQAKSGDGAKCPVPRPILNVLTRKREGRDASSQPVPRSRTNEEYVADQLDAFRANYGSLQSYEYAEAYLASILSLATEGVESPRANDVLKSGVYDESYKRVLSVLKSVGVVFEEDPETGRNRIAAKLVDKDLCLSMVDKLKIRQELLVPTSMDEVVPVLEASSGTDKVEEADEAAITNESESSEGKSRLKFWRKDKKDLTDDATDEVEVEVELTAEDLGGVLLSAEEPTMTRQLNVLSNIVQRALLFGGDQELLVLAETLDADRVAFAERWYPNTGGIRGSVDEEETRPGLQFLNCLVRLLRDCYENGTVTDLEPPLPLARSYANSYERLVGAAVELGSGYIKPVASDLMAMPAPRTAQEELGRFAVWESNFRQSTPSGDNAYPEDLEGEWEVRDEIGGETIGTSTVSFGPNGIVDVQEPLEGLRWRLDPGPTHLDTCTFQVLGSDGTILQYRGFIDRGARLEARFSRRPIKIRGSVMFQMRDGSTDYYKDMLPINYRTGTTKFVMTRIR